MDEKSDREAAAAAGTGQRMAAFPSDPVTIERLQKLVQQLEEQLRKSEQARAANYYLGARKPWNQPSVSRDFIGSISSPTSWGNGSQAGHSNVLMLKQEAPGVIRASIKVAWHLGQRGR
jgi:hypothetical protein